MWFWIARQHSARKRGILTYALGSNCWTMASQSVIVPVTWVLILSSAHIVRSSWSLLSPQFADIVALLLGVSWPQLLKSRSCESHSQHIVQDVTTVSHPAASRTLDFYLKIKAQWSCFESLLQDFGSLDILPTLIHRIAWNYLTHRDPGSR